jgi:pantothenate kinase
VAIGPEVEVVVTEGNYLLLDRPGWREVRAELDEVWFVMVREDLRLERLLARHVAFGKSPEQARAWVRDVDEPNARLIEATREDADRVLDLTGWTPRAGRVAR